MITIDGSEGEGGGQILRSALALSLISGQPFLMDRIRAGRGKPGLLRQHLTAVEAARTVGGAAVTGAELGSEALSFAPRSVMPGRFRFAVGSAGSATLVLQTVLPPLLVACGPSTLTLEGGTHNPFAPPFDFVAASFAPLIGRMGPLLRVTLEQPGFFPAGGGRFRAEIEPVGRLARLELLTRGEVRRRRARALVSRLPTSVADRELAAIREQLGWSREECVVEPVAHAAGPGNVLLLEIETAHVTAVFAGFGERGRPAEAVADGVARAAAAWLRADVPVEEHLADQLLLPLALAGGGVFRTTVPSSHAHTNANVIRRFLPVEIRFEQEDELAWRVIVSGAGSMP